MFNTDLVTFLQNVIPKGHGSVKNRFQTIILEWGLRTDNEDWEFSLTLDPLSGVQVSLNLFCQSIGKNLA